VEELATKRKQMHNLDPLGSSQKNAYAILNNINDDALIKSAKDLYISLPKDEEGCRQVITSIKAEEMLRANIPEAKYQTHLEHLQHMECDQDADILDLIVILNEHRDLPEKQGASGNPKGTKVKKGNSRKKKYSSYFGILEGSGRWLGEGRLGSISWERIWMGLGFRRPCRRTFHIRIYLRLLETNNLSGFGKVQGGTLGVS
jgi:hypothetical protein